MTSNASASGVSKPLFSSSAVTSAANKERITLIVDETPFMVDAKLFANHHNTLLGRMFANKNFELKTNSRGEYDIGRGTCLTSSIFRIILVTIFISNIVSLSIVNLLVSLIKFWILIKKNFAIFIYFRGRRSVYVKLELQLI